MPPSSFTRRSAGSATRRSRQARRRVAAPAAGSVAASKARRCPDQLKIWRKSFVPTAWVNRRCGGRVLGETQHRDVEGVSARLRSRRTRPANAARANFDRTPSESDRPGRIQGARAESSQVHASRAAARAPAPREAHHPHFKKKRSKPHRRSILRALRASQSHRTMGAQRVHVVTLLRHAQRVSTLATAGARSRPATGMSSPSSGRR